MNEGLGRAATPEHLAHVAVPGWDRAEQLTRARCSAGAKRPVPHPISLHPYLTPSLPPVHPHLTSVPLCPAAAHRPPRALAVGCRQLAALSPVASMLLSPLVPQNQCC